jgi:hypothetical protein
MGRIPKLVKERALREQKEEQMRREAAVAGPSDGSDGALARELSCSSMSDRSIENDDPNAMETGKKYKFNHHVINSYEIIFTFFELRTK